jgi:hypothetical protein
VPELSRTAQLALEILEEAIRLSDPVPLRPPAHGVRLALAYLWSLSLTKDRNPVDALWRGLMGQSPHQGSSRTSWCQAQLASIRVDAGIED